MDAVTCATEALTIGPLTLARALQCGPALLALGADQPWETWTMAHLLSQRPAKWDLSCLALLGAQPVGYAIASARPHSIHLHHLIVGQPWRSQGVGHQLLCALARKAQERGVAYLSLKVHKQNVQALRFYVRHGLCIVEAADPELFSLQGAVVTLLAETTP